MARQQIVLTSFPGNAQGDTITQAFKKINENFIEIYSGVTSIVTVGTITTGTWNASVIDPIYGGTGVANNAASTLTISGSFGITITVSATTAVTLPTAGTLATLAGTEILSGKTLSGFTMTDATNVILNATTGTKWGTATTQKQAWFNATPVVQQAGLTAITHTAPGTPDYALQDLVQNTGFGFATKDEGNTLLSVVKAMHDAMKTYGFLS